jgi:hypothetical protein
MKKIERFLIMLSLIGIIARMMLAGGSSLTLLLSLMSLSLLYMYFGFALFNDIRLRDIFKKASYKGLTTIHIVGAILAGLALSMACVGILFKVQSWPGATFDLGVSLSLCSIIIVISYSKIKGPHRQYYKRITSRLVVATVISAFLLVIPRKGYLEFMQRDNPAFIKVQEAQWDHPDSVALQQRVREEHNKMNHH